MMETLQAMQMAALVTAVADLDPAGEADGSVCGALRPAVAGGA